MFSENYLTLSDNYKIYYRIYNHLSAKKPLICLAGLTRNSKDFHEFAVYRQNKFDDKIIAIDMCGRGKSDYTPSERYELNLEVADILSILKHEKIACANFLGTSRGAMQIAVIASLQPELVDKVIFNDMGCKIPVTALDGIARLFGKGNNAYRTMDDALRARRVYDNGQTKNLTLEEEMNYLFCNFKVIDGVYHYDYDKAGLGEAFSKGVEIIKSLEQNKLDLTLFMLALAEKPILLLHGENSDILTDEIAKETLALWKNAFYLKVKDRGHVPFLNEKEVLEKIDEFLG